jgi:hypothetical protein
MKNRICLLLFLLIAGQCTIQKRLHSNGYTMRRSSKLSSVEDKSPVYEDNVIADETIAEENVPTTVQHEKTLPPIKTIEVLEDNTAKFEKGPGKKLKCGTIELASGTVLEYSELRIIDNRLEYRPCSNMKEEKWMAVDAEEVDSIKDKNGGAVELSYSKEGDLQSISGKTTAGKEQEVDTSSILSIIISLFLSGIAGLVIALVARKKILANPERYKYQWINTLAIIVAIARIILTILIFIIVIGLFLML